MRLSMVSLALALTLSLAGCDTAEERAEKHFQSGMELLEQGDVDRALVEFRNVFDLNGQHKEARLVYARVQRERGRLGEAYGQYLRSVEQYPEEIESRRALAEMAIEGGNWDEAERHGREAAQLAPDDLGVRAIVAVLDYRDAILAEDDAAAAAAALAAGAVLEEDPARLIARRIRIDQFGRTGRLDAALDEVDAALEHDPDLIELHRQKLRLLAELGDEGGLGAQLQDMFARFPEDEETRQLLIAWYLQRGDLDGAETLLRDVAAAAGDDPAPRMAVVMFLRQTRGAEAAGAELDRLIAAGGPNTALYRASRAALAFDAGRQEDAIAELEEVLDGAEPSETTRNVKVALARMLLATGNAVGARARIEEVLEEEPGHVAALKMRAEWLIEDDKPGEAILALRTALDQTPRDPEILTLMGRAHERDGARELAGERYALAVEVSGRGAAESLRYARFLMATDRAGVAEGVLDDALTVAPRDLQLLTALADVQMRRANWDRAQSTIARIGLLGTDEARRAAEGLSARLLAAQDRTEEAVAALQSIAEESGNPNAATAAIVQTQIRAGRIAEARATLEEKLAEAPDDPALRFLRAGIHVVEGETEAAEEIYRALIAEEPRALQPVQALYGVLRSQGRAADATDLLDTALAANPQATRLNLLKAGELERAGDFEGAIAIYEDLYARNGDNMVIANNLASLISAHRDDDESLERAFAVARRLRGIEVPAFQDTYGWIAYRRGDLDAALDHLEPAAQSLPNDPLVQYHLGMTYQALERTEDAKAQFEKVLDLADPDSPLPQVERARQALTGME